MKSSSNECFFVDFPTFINNVDDDVDEAIGFEGEIVFEFRFE